MTNTELINTLRLKAAKPHELTNEERDLMFSLMWVCLDDINRKLAPLVMAHKVLVVLSGIFLTAVTAFITALMTGRVELVFL